MRPPSNLLDPLDVLGQFGSASLSLSSMFEDASKGSSWSVKKSRLLQYHNYGTNNSSVPDPHFFRLQRFFMYLSKGTLQTVYFVVTVSLFACSLITLIFQLEQNRLKFLNVIAIDNLYI